MKTIQYKSLHGLQHVLVPVVGLEFDNGESKPVTDEQAEILLRNNGNGEFFDVSAPAVRAAISQPAPAEE